MSRITSGYDSERLDLPLDRIDPEMSRIVQAEKQRQESTLILIPSENYAPRAVLEVQGSAFTNKYAEGYGKARYYNGCRWSIEAEDLAIQRAKAIFGADHANVQVHSGSQANMAVYYALLEPGDRVLAMNLNHGGHLTHGNAFNFSGRTYKFESYGVDRETGRLDYDSILRQAREFAPKMIVTGASAYPRAIDFARFGEIARQVGALLVADISHIAGLVAGSCHASPFPHAHVVTSTTHKTLRGPRGAMILSRSEFASKIDKAVFPGVQSGPFMHAIAAKAVAFGEAATDSFRAYARRVVQNAAVLAEELGRAGFNLVSGGTDNHLLLIDLTSTSLTGREAADLLEEAGIVVNKNTIPFDSRPPTVTSGIRLGSPAVSSRGMGPGEMRRIAAWIADVLSHPSDAANRRKVALDVEGLCREFPAPLSHALV